MIRRNIPGAVFAWLASLKWAHAAGEIGVASYYSGERHEGGDVTANGERFDPTAMTAAHRTFPFDTMVRVTDFKNGKQIIVRINDRGPFVTGRVIDLTPAGMRALGGGGLRHVRLERL